MIDPRFTALTLIRGAYVFARRELTDAQEVIFEVRINDAARDGLTTAEEMAFRALEREGFAPSWLVTGEVRTIKLGIPSPAQET